MTNTFNLTPFWSFPRANSTIPSNVYVVPARRDCHNNLVNRIGSSCVPSAIANTCPAIEGNALNPSINSYPALIPTSLYPMNTTPGIIPTSSCNCGRH